MVEYWKEGENENYDLVMQGLGRLTYHSKGSSCTLSFFPMRGKKLVKIESDAAPSKVIFYERDTNGTPAQDIGGLGAVLKKHHSRITKAEGLPQADEAHLLYAIDRKITPNPN